MNADTKIVIPPDWEPDVGIIESAYGPEEAGTMDDIIGHPPELEKDEPPADG